MELSCSRIKPEPVNRPLPICGHPVFLTPHPVFLTPPPVFLTSHPVFSRPTLFFLFFQALMPCRSFHKMGPYSHQRISWVSISGPWNLAGTFLEPCRNMAGTALKSCWNLAGTFLEASWNLVISGTLLEHCRNRYCKVDIYISLGFLWGFCSVSCRV